MIEIKKEECCGCRNCEISCPVNAITMKPDQKGFYYPSIDNEKCIKCDLCRKVCPFIDNGGDNNQSNFVAAYKRKDAKKRLKSQSGGAFASFAEYLFSQNLKLAIYGVALSQDLKAEYKRITNRAELDMLLGSKYVQADIKSSMSSIVDDLKNGFTVLFCGTPCYVAAVQQYIKQFRLDTGNLILIDMICHGVLSPRMYYDYIEESKKWGDLKGFISGIKELMVGGVCIPE